MEAQQKAYEEFFTTCITKAPGLKYFDVNEVVIVSVDASSEGLGAYLLQGNQPEACASRSLNSTKQNYTQFEKEMVAIVFGTSKFHQYIYEKQLWWKLTTNPSRVCSKKHRVYGTAAHSANMSEWCFVRVYSSTNWWSSTDLVTNCTLQIPLAVLVRWSLHHRQTSLKFICSWVSQKKRLTSLKERQTLTQCYEKPVKGVILTTAIGSIKTTSLQFIYQNFMI